MATTPYYEIVDVVTDGFRNEIVDVFVDEHVDDVNALIDSDTRDNYAEVIVATTDGEAQASHPWKSYWVFVEDLQGKTHQVSTFDHEDVIYFADKVSNKTGVPFLLLSFIVNGRQVEFGRRVGDYEVGPDCSFRMTGRLIE